MLNIVVKELAQEYGWDDRKIAELLMSFIEAHDIQGDLVSYLVRTGKSEKKNG
jgi:hypothetical protein